ncbi:hypothetical protein HRbin35_00004 [bacterium HR35]|nr:hypothetical protein HRbin35_00004 [bacterium HR35]
MQKRIILWFIVLNILFILPLYVFAHEAYVVPKDYFWQEIAKPINPYAINVLKNPQDLIITLKITAFVLLLIILNFLFRLSSFGERVHHFF